MVFCHRNIMKTRIMGLYPFPFLPMVLCLRKGACPGPKSFWMLFVIVLLGGMEDGRRSGSRGKVSED